MSRRQRKIAVCKIFAVTLIIISALVSITVFSNGSGNKYGKYEEVFVKPGDTLWSIAEEHYGNSIDIREAVYAIKECSEINGGTIYSGQTIKLPALSE